MKKTFTPSFTPTNTLTSTITMTFTNICTVTPTFTITETPYGTATFTPTVTATPTITMTTTITPRPLVKPLDVLYLNRNSFNPKAIQNNQLEIRYAVISSTTVTIRIYSVAGRLVRTIKPQDVTPGFVYVSQWDGRGEDGRIVASGLYLIHIEAGGYKQIKKVIVLTW